MNIFEEQKKYDEAMKAMRQDVCSDILNYITDDILQQKNNAVAIEFAKSICDLLKQNGVYIKFTQIKSDDNVTKNSVEEKYNIFFDGADFSEHDKKFIFEIEKIRSQAEYFRQELDETKKERDFRICECEKKIEELENHHKFSMMQIDDVLMNFLGVTHEIMDKPHDFEKVLQEVIDKNKTDFDLIPTEPIKVADMLINAEGEYEHSPIVKSIIKSDKGTYRIFDVPELRQIAEHLLVYCNNNGGNK